jgi:hypothetical protein
MIKKVSAKKRFFSGMGRHKKIPPDGRDEILS